MVSWRVPPLGRGPWKDKPRQLPWKTQPATTEEPAKELAPTKVPTKEAGSIEEPTEEVPPTEELTEEMAPVEEPTALKVTVSKPAGDPDIQPCVV